MDMTKPKGVRSWFFVSIFSFAL